MAIETTYQSLLGAQRQRRKRQERQDTLLQAGTLATNLYQQNLDKKAQEFFDRTEVADQRVKYQEGYDLFNNKIKKIYDQGNNSVGGLGNYLVENYAMGIAQDRIYANYDEDMVKDPDELGSAVRSYAEEMVYGTRDAEGNRVGGAMLDRLTAAYNSGKTLQGMDKYDEYVSRRADLPENVGMALVGKFFDKKSRQEVEQDALRRIRDENQFTQDSAAFMTLAQAFDQGMTITDSEKVAKKVDTFTEGLKRKPTEVVKDKRVVSAKRPDGRGGEITWTYIETDYFNQSEGTTRTVASANKADPFSARIFNNEEVKLPTEAVEEERIDPLTGKKFKTSSRSMYHISGDKIGEFVDTIEEIPDEKGALTTDVDPVLIKAAGQTVGNVLSKLPDSAYVTDAFDKYQIYLYGEDEDRKETFRTDFNRNVHIMGFNLSTEYGFNPSTGRQIAAQIALNNVRYIEDTGGEMKNYQGANLAASSETNGLRILEAIQDLNAADPEFRLGGITSDGFESLVADLISQPQLIEFRGRKGAATREGSIFDEESRRYFLKRNFPSDFSNRNIFNNRIPYASADGGVMTLYDYIEMETMGSTTRGQNSEEYYKELDEATRRSRRLKSLRYKQEQTNDI
jgi:hypothetical protein